MLAACPNKTGIILTGGGNGAAFTTKSVHMDERRPEGKRPIKENSDLQAHIQSKGGGGGGGCF